MGNLPLSFYLSRPYKIASGSFATTDAATTFVPYAMPQQALYNAIYANKPKGRLGFRATMVFRLVVNAERFQQGRYMLTWCPLGGAKYDITTTTQRGNRWVNNHSATLVQRSNLPRVEFDLNCDTEAVLRIPYSSVHDYYVFDWANTNTTGYGTWGVVRLYPYVPLTVSTGSNTCSYSLFVHFEDIEFVGFAASTINPQSANPFSASIKKKNASQQEAQNKGVGPIEGFSRKVAHATKILSPLPMLGSFAGSLSWVSDIIADSANVFGWSSPGNIEKVTRMQRTNFPYYVNYNKVDNSLPMGYNTDNMVDVAPGFGGTNVDELDLTYFCSIPTYSATWTWSTATSVGSGLGTLTVNPHTLTNSVTYQTFTNYNLSPMQYVANKFSLWRGSIVYKFKIVKTEFHSGRLSIAHFPYQGGTPSNSNGDYVQRDIIDIREHNEFSITVPWNRPEQYGTYNMTNGTLNVIVFDALVAPDSVPSSISIIVEIAGGPDLEFAGAHNSSTFTMNSDFTIQSVNPFTSKVDCGILAKPIGVAAIPKFQTDTSRLCIGERITSMRQMLKRVWGIDHTTPTAAKIMRVLPFCAQTLDTTGATASYNTTADFYAELCHMFMYSRGSVRIKFAPLQNTTLPWLASLGDSTFLNTSTSLITGAATSFVSGNSVSANTGYQMSNCSTVLVDVPSASALEVQVPMYSLTKARNNCNSIVNNSFAFDASDPGAPQQILEFTTADDSSAKLTYSRFILGRAGGDDANFSLFVSIPPVVFSGAAA